MGRASHDGFFKANIHRKEVLHDFLYVRIPVKIRSMIHFQSLDRVDPNTVNKHLKKYERDTSYRGVLKNGVEVFILIEHQSSPDRLLPFRMLAYNVMLIQEYLLRVKDENKPLKHLPLIVNVCLYHNQKPCYPYPLDLKECFSIPDFASVPTCKLLLHDLTITHEEEIWKSNHASIMEIMFKYSHSEEMVEALKRLGDVRIMKIIGKLGNDYLGVILTYASKFKWGKDIFDYLESILEPKKETIMSYREELIKVGEARGERRGEKKGRLKVAENLLLCNIPTTQVSKFTELPLSEVKDLLKYMRK